MISKFTQIIKKMKLKRVYIRTYMKKNIGKWISYSIMFICVMMFILALFSDVAHRLPMLSFFAKEMKMPYLFEVCGAVHIVDEDEEITVPIKVSIGGYSTDARSGEQYQMRFSAVEKNDIPIIISFIHEEIEYTKIEYLDYSNQYNLTCEYKYILGE